MKWWGREGFRKTEMGWLKNWGCGASHVIRILCSHCWGPGFDPGQGTRSCKLCGMTKKEKKRKKKELGWEALKRIKY